MIENSRKLQEAVNVMAAVVKENAQLRQALSTAKSDISTLQEGISPHTYRIAYSNATPKKYSALAADAMNAIDEVLSK